MCLFNFPIRFQYCPVHHQIILRVLFFFCDKNFFLLKTKKSSGEEVARMQFAASLKEWKMMISEV